MFQDFQISRDYLRHLLGRSIQDGLFGTPLSAGTPPRNGCNLAYLQGPRNHLGAAISGWSELISVQQQSRPYYVAHIGVVDVDIAQGQDLWDRYVALPNNFGRGSRPAFSGMFFGMATVSLAGTDRAATSLPTIQVTAEIPHIVVTLRVQLADEAHLANPALGTPHIHYLLIQFGFAFQFNSTPWSPAVNLQVTTSFSNYFGSATVVSPTAGTPFRAYPPGATGTTTSAGISSIINDLFAPPSGATGQGLLNIVNNWLASGQFNCNWTMAIPSVGIANYGVQVVGGALSVRVQTESMPDYTLMRLDDAIAGWYDRVQPNWQTFYNRATRNRLLAVGSDGRVGGVTPKTAVFLDGPSLGIELSRVLRMALGPAAARPPTSTGIAIQVTDTPRAQWHPGELSEPDTIQISTRLRIRGGCGLGGGANTFNLFDIYASLTAHVSFTDNPGPNGTTLNSLLRLGIGFDVGDFLWLHFCASVQGLIFGSVTGPIGVAASHLAWAILGLFPDLFNSMIGGTSGLTSSAGTAIPSVQVVPGRNDTIMLSWQQASFAVAHTARPTRSSRLYDEPDGLVIRETSDDVAALSLGGAIIVVSVSDHFHWGFRFQGVPGHGCGRVAAIQVCISCVGDHGAWVCSVTVLDAPMPELQFILPSGVNGGFWVPAGQQRCFNAWIPDTTVATYRERTQLRLLIVSPAGSTIAVVNRPFDSRMGAAPNDMADARLQCLRRGDIGEVIDTIDGWLPGGRRPGPHGLLGMQPSDLVINPDPIPANPAWILDTSNPQQGIPSIDRGLLAGTGDLERLLPGRSSGQENQ